VTPLEGRPGVVAVRVLPCGDRRPVAECACCGRVRLIRGRGLCAGCTWSRRNDGTIGEWGWTRADRLAEYAALRGTLTRREAAARLGVSVRTADRYEAALRAGEAA
jgi:hypothetical protein